MKNIYSTYLMNQAIVFVIISSLAIATTSASLTKQLYDFSESSSTSRWISVNDNVMGGISKGSFRLSSNEMLLFSGSLSLENRGGFASIRTRPTDYNLDGYNTMAIRIKGDGRTYYLNLRSSMRNNGAGSYRASFKTKAGQWQEVRIALKDFKYTAYGWHVPGVRPIKGEEVRSVGFTIADKKAGPFRLEVDWIRAERKAHDNLVSEQSGIEYSDMSAKAVIERAISRGVPLFNSGQASACTAVYEAATKTLLDSHVNALSEMDYSTLREALRDMRAQEQNPSQQAWTLRYALDQVYESLNI